MALQIEIIADRLGVDQPSGNRTVCRLLVIALIHKGRINIGEIIICHRLIQAFNRIIAEVPVGHEGNCPSRDSKSLTEEGKASSSHIVIISVCKRETVCSLVGEGIVISSKVGEFGVSSSTEIYLRLNKEGCIFRELVIKAEAHPVAV